jgi:hypothetical protein
MLGYGNMATKPYPLEKAGAMAQAGAEGSWEERCDYEAWFWSQMPDKDPHATGLSWNDYRGKPFVYPEEMHATHWTGETAVKFLKGYERPQPFFLKVSFLRP